MGMIMWDSEWKVGINGGKRRCLCCFIDLVWFKSVIIFFNILINKKYKIFLV